MNLTVSSFEMSDFHYATQSNYTEEHNPYNRSGSLLTWNGQYHILEKHFQENSYGMNITK